MAAIGRYPSLDKAIRDSLWHNAELWSIHEEGRVLLYTDGLELIKPVLTGRWTVSRPLGYIRVSWWTHFVINAMVHREINQ